MKEVAWKCPHCGGANTDDRDETAIPMCGDCDKSVDWEEIGA